MVETSPVNPSTTAHDWRQVPLRLAWPGRLPGLSAGLFAGAGARDLELASRADSRTHVVSIGLVPCHLAFAIDGRQLWDGEVRPGDVTIVQAGAAPSSVVNGDWRVIQLYLPAADLSQVAEDLGVSTVEARGVEVACPRFRPDRVLTGVGRGLARRLCRGETLSRLELDELALALAERVVRRFTNLRPPRRRRAPGLSRLELSLALDLLQGAEDPGLVDIACLLGRTPAEIKAAFASALGVAPGQVRRTLRRDRLS